MTYSFISHNREKKTYENRPNRNRKVELKKHEEIIDGYFGFANVTGSSASESCKKKKKKGFEITLMVVIVVKKKKNVFTCILVIPSVVLRTEFQTEIAS